MPNFGFKHSEKTKKIMRKIRKGKKPLCSFAGHKHTDEYKKYMSKKMKGREFSKKHRKNLSESKKGHTPWNKGKRCFQLSREHCHFWKGGRIYDGRGYILLYMPEHPYAINRYIRQSHFVVEQQIGRYLLPIEKVHHINHIKDDDRPKNLMAFINHSAHIKFENSHKIKSSKIVFDGRKLQ